MTRHSSSYRDHKIGTAEEEIDNYHHIWCGVTKYQQNKNGVCLFIWKSWKRYIITSEQYNERIVRVETNIHGCPAIILGLYAMNDNASTEEKEDFCDILREIVDWVPEHKEFIITGT